MRSEMCSLHLTHPSGAVGSRHCSARGAVAGSVPCSRVSTQSWTLPARAGIRTHNLGLPQVSSPTLQPLGHNCPTYPHKSYCIYNVYTSYINTCCRFYIVFKAPVVEQMKPYHKVLPWFLASPSPLRLVLMIEELTVGLQQNLQGPSSFGTC